MRLALQGGHCTTHASDTHEPADLICGEFAAQAPVELPGSGEDEREEELRLRAEDADLDREERLETNHQATVQEIAPA